jgi:hypothetical protein
VKQMKNFKVMIIGLGLVAGAQAFGATNKQCHEWLMNNEQYEQLIKPIKDKYEEAKKPIVDKYENVKKPIQHEFDEMTKENQEGYWREVNRMEKYKFRPKYSEWRSRFDASYQQNIAPALAKYDNDMKPIQEQYDNAMKPVQEEYDKAMQSYYCPQKRVLIHSELPAGKVLFIEDTDMLINSGDKVPVFVGEKVILKDSPNDYIKINRIGSGGDEKSGRLMSVCDDAFIRGKGGECSIHWVEPAK